LPVSNQPALLALEDGRVFHGYSFGAPVLSTGEICFNTSMTGYQEILTDPSYRGQIVAMTCPQIGNYGINPLDVESGAPQVRGFVIEEASPVVSNWRAAESLAEYLKRHGIPGIEGIDTRALTKHLRVRGAMRACLACDGTGEKAAIERARGEKSMEGSDFVREVSPASVSPWDPGDQESPRWIQAAGSEAVEEGLDLFEPLPAKGRRIAALDFGMKKNIARILRQHGLEVTLFPATSTAEEILAMDPEGIFLSNGPGDPAALGYAHETARALVASGKPVFGICLGHQILACAMGGRTFKLKFGHRGANQPVKDLRTGKIEITSQNHGFAVDPDSLPAEVEVTHINLNDGTVAGIRHRKFPVEGVQFHPEASPGPHDSAGFFHRFAKSIEEQGTRC
jgi:carbamoyl-phosphate synthase small subunit